MTNIIYKYPLNLGHKQIVNLPADPAFLTVQLHYGSPTLWAVVTPEKPPKKYIVSLVGTGAESVSTKAMYLGTIQLNEGALVFHAFIEEL